MMIRDLKAHAKLTSNSLIKENGCIEWTGLKDKDGYGMLYRLGITRAHRVSYTTYKGPIPEGALICHRCDNPSCINPAHLFLGTHKINADDRDLKGRHRNQNTNVTHCKNGHKFTEENLYLNERGGRKCKICALKYHQDNKEKLNKDRIIRQKLQREIAKQKIKERGIL